MPEFGDPWSPEDERWPAPDRSPRPREHRRRRTIVVVSVIVSVFLAFGVALVLQLTRGDEPWTPLGVTDVVVSPAAVPSGTVVPPPPGRSTGPTGPPGSGPDPTHVSVTADWVSNVAARTGIPARALTAYADAQLTTFATTPGCHLSWTMLAGIGAVESHHGTFGGSSLRADGTTTSTILGPPLDGSHGTKAVPATPAGLVLDGDPKWDHAVGPMQFIPSTWLRWATSADGGAPDPNDIDDAALTAARYLCAAGGDLVTARGWQAAIGAYNAPVAYALRVTELANTYARESLGY